MFISGTSFNLMNKIFTKHNPLILFKNEEFKVLGFKILTLPASHDSPGTTGFLIEYNNEKMAYITDTGYIHENIQKIS